MNRAITFLSITVFSIFIGSQITEGILLVPYWKSLPASDFYNYYAQFGPSIGRFYTCLTILAVLIPLGFSVFCFRKKSPALKYSVLSSLFALIIIAIFYFYFKGVNQQFFNASFDANQLKSELSSWEKWHWVRVIVETISLVFLFLTIDILCQNNEIKTED